MTAILPATWVPGPLSEAERIRICKEAAWTTARQALEVGHYLGASTSLLLHSLPSRCSLSTIDHHCGDVSTPEVKYEDFQANTQPYVGDRVFDCFIMDMRDALSKLAVSGWWRYGFVFYDADHTEQGVRDFWQLARGLLADECTLIYDDADWPGQAVLGELAATDGFHSVREREIVRHMPQDKVDPRTFTLEVMRRSHGT